MSERKGIGLWDIRTRMEVTMPPDSSSAAYQHWARTAPVTEVRRWERCISTLHVVEAVIQSGIRQGLTGE